MVTRTPTSPPVIAPNIRRMRSQIADYARMGGLAISIRHLTALLDYTEALQEAAVKWRDALDRHQALVDINAPAVLVEHACAVHQEASDALRALLPPDPDADLNRQLGAIAESERRALREGPP